MFFQSQDSTFGLVKNMIPCDHMETFCTISSKNMANKKNQSCNWLLKQLLGLKDFCILLMFYKNYQILKISLHPPQLWSVICERLPTQSLYRCSVTQALNYYPFTFKGWHIFVYRIRANTAPLLIRTPSWLERHSFAIF